MTDEATNEETPVERFAETATIRAAGLGPKCATGCKGGLERVTSTCRPGQVDVTVRCMNCGAVRHFVLDGAGNVLSDSAVPAKPAAAAVEETAKPVSASVAAPADEEPPELPIEKAPV